MVNQAATSPRPRQKNAEPDNPAVHIERPGNDVVKKASELNVEEKANGSADKNGEKRKHDEVAKEEEKAEEKTEDKKQKKEPAPKKETAKTKAAAAKKDAPAKAEEPKATEKKKAGRPKGTAGGAKKKEPTPRSGDGVGSRTRSQGK